MEVKTQEVIRYIDLRFMEQDLEELRDEIDKVYETFKASYHEKAHLEKIKKLMEFRNVIDNAMCEIKS